VTTFRGLGASDTSGIAPGYQRPGCTQTTTVREMRGLRIFLHYLDPADPTRTLCGVDAAATVEHEWPRQICECFGCERVAKLRRVGP
jgi:hypothetical protein